ncbi:hypothetical protein PGT21_017679 [Puccinia graminis f. sp. tritici]|uniref:Uncharacterized protein n=1 Tax=Puccinia graminis f. sp. tritici TaxID=56615 RepID=A0A5B0LJ27_PUCGR|nr:hypothetical protein PGT21_017679 [Puccinia graminis f. sp. tritici]
MKSEFEPNSLRLGYLTSEEDDEFILASEALRMGGFGQSVPVPIPHEPGVHRVHQRKELSKQFVPPIANSG